MYSSRLIRDRVFVILVVAMALLGVAPLFHLFYTLITRGGRTILELGISFFVDIPALPGAEEVGGIAPALVGSFILVLISSLMSVPLALLVAIFLYEFRYTSVARITRVVVMSLLEIPTILIGILVYAIVVVWHGEFSLFAGGIALAIVVLPYTITYIERALDSVPLTYREAGYAIGLNRLQVVFYVVAGVARRSILAGIIVGIAKSLGETAPLLFTIGGARNTININPLQAGDAIPLLVFQFAMSPYKNWHDAAWGASLVLVLSLILAYTLAKLFVKDVRL